MPVEKKILISGTEDPREISVARPKKKPCPCITYRQDLRSAARGDPAGIPLATCLAVRDDHRSLSKRRSHRKRPAHLIRLERDPEPSSYNARLTLTK